VVIHNTRTAAGPRNKVLFRYPTIRTCCIQESFIRAAWWFTVEEYDHLSLPRDSALAALLDRDRPKILSDLEEVVLRPSEKWKELFLRYAGSRVFRRYQDHQNRLEAERRRQAEELRRQQEERAQQEAAEQAERMRWGWRYRYQQYFDVLGLPTSASEEEMKKRFRELAKAHHPDRGGDLAMMKRINEAHRQLEQAFRENR
jgi:hypothetical protein